MASVPRVSVVLRLRAGFCTGPALDSLRFQTFGDYEVLVVGEGAGEVAALAADPRVRALRDGESGSFAARNRGVTAARAEWVAFLDAGDAWREDHLAELVAATRFGDAVAVFGNPVLGEGGRPLLPMSVPSGRVSDPFDFALRIGTVPFRASAALVERAAAIDAGLFPDPLRRRPGPRPVGPPRAAGTVSLRRPADPGARARPRRGACRRRPCSPPP